MTGRLNFHLQQFKRRKFPGNCKTARTIKVRDLCAALVFFQVRGELFGTQVSFNGLFATEGGAASIEGRCNGVSSIEKTGDISTSNLS